MFDLIDRLFLFLVACRVMVYQIQFCLNCFNDSIELHKVIFDGRAFRYLAVVWREKIPPECVDVSAEHVVSTRQSHLMNS